MKKEAKQYKPGDMLSVRLSKKYAQEDLQVLNDIKSKHDRDFNAIAVPILLQGLEKYKKGREEVTIPLPSALSSEQLERFNNYSIKQLIGQIVFQLLENPGKPIAFPVVNETEEVENEDDKENEEIADSILEKNGFLDF